MPMDGYLQLEGIEGECKESAHRGWIDVSGFTWSVSQEVAPGQGGKPEAGVPSVSDFTFTQKLGRSSPVIFEACCTGRQFATVTFEGLSPHGASRFKYLSVRFKDCLITSVGVSNSGETVTERIQVAFRSVNAEMKERPGAT